MVIIVTKRSDADAIDWAYMVRHLAEAHRKVKARADAALEARDDMIRDLGREKRLTQVELARAAGLSQPQIAKIINTKEQSP